MTGAVSEPARAEPLQPTAVFDGSSVSAKGFALLALCAIVAAKGLAPALPGTTTGIARLISASVWLAASMSQLVAAGGIAFCVRLLGNVFALPSLGIAFRFTLLPVGLSVIALTAASATRPLDIELGKMLALCAVIAPGALMPFLRGRRVLREVSIALAAAALAFAFDFVAYELSRRTGTSEPRFWPLLSWATLLLDAVTALFALRALSNDWRAAGRVLVGAFAFAAIGMLLARWGASHTASSVLVLMQRLVEALSARRWTAIPAVLSHSIALVTLWLAAALLGRERFRPDVRAALSLLLLARTCGAAPISALLTLTSTLLLARAVTDPHLLPERESRKPTN